MPAVLSLSVRDFGAVGDGRTNDTRAVQAALDASPAGGGRVVLPSGTYLCGTLRPRSGTTLVLEEGAILRGTTDPSDFAFPEVPQGKPGARRGRWHRAFLLLDGVERVRIEGPGCIDAAGIRDAQGEEGMRGPHTVVWSDAHHCAIEGVTIRDSGNYAMLALDTSDLSVQRVTVTGGWDGFHARHCAGIRLRDCRFHTGDDAIAGAYLDDCVFSHSLLNSSCNAIRIIGPARGLNVSDCRIIGPGEHPHITQHRHNALAAVVFQPGAWEPMPGPSERVTFARLRIHNVQTAFHVALRTGCPLEDLRLEDIEAEEVYGPAASLETWDDTPLRRITLRRVRVAHTLARPDRSDAHPHARDHHQQMGAEIPPLRLGPRPLPCWGLYARQVEHLELDHVTLQRPEACAYPALLLEKVNTLRSTNVTVVAG